ncbi:MAG: penicillin-binding transpeptidase domain-containing protein [Lewinella sp.]
MKWFIPPVLTVCCMGLMVLLHRTLPLARLWSESWRTLGIGLLTAGVLMIASIGFLLLRRDTEIHTFGQPRKLVTEGLFRFSRNPIYLGFLISLVGVWVYLGSLSPVVGCFIFFLVADRWYIPFEEEQLDRQFGAAYEGCQKRVGRWVWFLFFVLIHVPPLGAQTDLRQPFIDCGVVGSITLYDHQAGKWIASDIRDSHRETLPASTFKVLHTLIILEERTVANAQEIIPWPGHTDTVKYGYRPEIYRDMPLRRAFRASAGWAYIEQAKKIDKDKYRQYLAAADYGNGDLSIDDPDFWNYGGFGVTPVNQIETLIGVYEETLPFRPESFTVLKDIMIEEQTEDYTLRAKTGWTRDGGINTGWWIGYLETEDNVWFFATRLQRELGEDGLDFGACRKEITWKVLKDILQRTGAKEVGGGAQE